MFYHGKLYISCITFFIPSFKGQTPNVLLVPKGRNKLPGIIMA